MSWFSKSKLAPVLAVIGALAVPGAGLAQQTTGAGQAYDPFEPANRGLYALHRGLDRVLIRPAMLVYVAVLPDPIRAGLRNVVGNLGEPITFVNDVLQVRPRAAIRTAARFAANSTVGVGGLFDMTTDAGLPRHYSDFGQTLGRYGLPPGPYIFVPVLGPSSLRDVGGRVADSYADPVRWVHYDGDTAVRIARPVITGLELRATFDREIESLDETATDPYVTLRSAYLQNRQSQIRGGQVDVEALPSFTPENPTSAAVADAPAIDVQGSFFRRHP